LQVSTTFYSSVNYAIKDPWVAYSMANYLSNATFS